MSKEKDINELTTDIYSMIRSDTVSRAIASVLYAKGYRKVDEDYARQCTCYTLGCQMAEQLEKKVAKEIFAEIGKRLDALLEMAPGGGEYTSAKTFLYAHWEFIANSIISKYTDGGK